MREHYKSYNLEFQKHCYSVIFLSQENQRLGVGPYALTVYCLEVKHDKDFYPSSFMKLTASCFRLSSTLSELALLCVAQEGVQGNNGAQLGKYRSSD